MNYLQLLFLGAVVVVFTVPVLILAVYLYRLFAAIDELTKD
jgi:hypothetical protein